jgi:hypothetical protein
MGNFDLVSTKGLLDSICRSFKRKLRFGAIDKIYTVLFRVGILMSIYLDDAFLRRFA